MKSSRLKPLLQRAKAKSLDDQPTVVENPAFAGMTALRAKALDPGVCRDDGFKGKGKIKMGPSLRWDDGLKAIALDPGIRRDGDLEALKP